MTALSRKKAKKKNLVDELEGLRKATCTQTGGPVTKRMLSLAVCENADYYAAMIKHPTSSPSNERVEDIKTALRRFQEVYRHTEDLQRRDDAALGVSTEKQAIEVAQ